SHPGRWAQGQVDGARRADDRGRTRHQTPNHVDAECGRQCATTLGVDRREGRVDNRLRRAVHEAIAEREAMARITGIGGIFFKSKGKGASLAAWYRDHLGLALEDFGGAILRWPADRADDGGLTVWHVADGDSQWFSPSSSSFMINYRVDNL